MAEEPKHDIATGYGPSAGGYARLIFDGDERKYDTWEVKFLAYMRLRKLKNVILPPPDTDVSADKNPRSVCQIGSVLGR